MTPANADTNRSARRPLVSACLAAFAVVLALVASGCVNNTPADTWEVQNQNPQNTRYVGGRITTGKVSNVAVAWTADVESENGFGESAPQPLISREFVYIQTSGGIKAFNRYTGEPAPGATKIANAKGSAEWLGEYDEVKSATEKLALENLPILTNTDVSDPEDGTKIVVNSTNKGGVIALNLDTGDQEWKRQLESEGDTSPRIVSAMAAANNSIFAPVVNVPRADSGGSLEEVYDAMVESEKATGSLVSINAENGDVNWTKKLSSAPLGGVTVMNNVAFVTTVDGNIYGFDRDSGDQVWTSKLPAGSATPTAASDDMLIVPVSVVREKGQKAQVVAFRIGGLGEVGGAEAPKLQQAEEGERAEATEGAAAEGEAAGAEGKTIFTENCGGCHTLADAGTNGAVGPNLDDLKPSEAQVTAIVTKGRGGMPSFEGTLSPEEIKAVAAYVSSVAGS